MIVGLDGRMRPDEAARVRAGIDSAQLRHAIDITLDLDCERPRMAREKAVEQGQLCRFWTTERQYLGPPAEAWISGHAALLHFV